MSDDVLPEWGIKLRNLTRRIGGLVQEDHKELHEMKAKVARLEARQAQTEQLVRTQATTIGVMQAQAMGHGSTSAEG